MGFLNILSLVAGPVLTLVKGMFGSNSMGATITDAIDKWSEGRERRKNLQLEADLAITKAQTNAKIEQIRQKTKLYADADQESIRQWQYGIKDDVLTYSIVALIFACFIPDLQPYVYRGVQILESLPIWLQVIIVLVYVSVLGLRFAFMAPIREVFGIGVKRTPKAEETDDAR